MKNWQNSRSRTAALLLVLLTGAAQGASLPPADLDALGLPPVTDPTAPPPLPPDLWQDTSRQTLAQFLQRLPRDIPSVPLRSLARRLMTVEADLPPGPPIQPSDAGALLGARLIALAQWGDGPAVDAILARVPSRRLTQEDLIRAQVLRSFTSGQPEDACARQDQRQGPDDGFWLGVRIACLLIRDQAKEAAALLKQTRDQTALNPLLSMLAERLGSTKSLADLPWPEGQPISVPSAVVLRTYGLIPPKAETLDGMGAGFALLADAPTVPAAQRLPVAEAAALRGALPLAVLDRLYREVGAGQDRAAAHVALLRATQPPQQVVALADALMSAQRAGLLPLAAKLYAPLLRALPVLPGAVPQASIITRALLLGDTPRLAAPWVSLLRRAAEKDAGARADLPRLAILARLAFGEEAALLDTPLLQDWAETPPAPDPALMSLVFAAFDGLEEPLPPYAWDFLAAPTHRTGESFADAAGWLRLRAAALAGRVGEVAALSLILSDGNTPKPGEALRLNALTAALRYAGLEDTARALALESIIQAGL
ncbi:hypothetical protein GCM10011497_11810 [Elstera cyanobacteriorum]|uniref:Uncharacterized protein n=1 Tax=Elstera cyanobacteriorum TaxID=2022747 RepID=A0A255XM14_9PROT|nr:hypothetical protein [Elstera cyanobacteriorum]OYQ18009.1 hypothetical protein CHR90_13655 [Elstera cyanobacteriorum]GFZ84499.1 hypothetical protein GCM10011497_11810 [Elstera cyanobacteriorum]